MAKRKPKLEKIDGLGPAELKMVHKAVRQVWSWSRAWRLAKARCLGPDGFPHCELCKKKVPKVSVDHIQAVGEIGGPNYIQRMFVPSVKLQCLCKACHAVKTKVDNKITASKKKTTVSKKGRAFNVDDYEW